MPFEYVKRFATFGRKYADEINQELDSHGQDGRAHVKAVYPVPVACIGGGDSVALDQDILVVFEVDDLKTEGSKP